MDFLRRALWVLVAVLVTACQMDSNNAGQSLDSSRHPLGLRNHNFNGSVQPVTQNGITTFTIRNHECSKVLYGDGRGEHDCRNGIVRSNLSSYDSNVGAVMEYSFDFMVDPAIKYSGYYNDHARSYLPGSRDSRLRIASWEGNRLHNFLFSLKLDARKGVWFLDRTCAGPQTFGKWVNFSMKVKWARDESGWMEVSCDGRVIYASSGTPTTVDVPHCYITNLCRPELQNDPTKVLFILGPVMQGFGYEWKKHRKPSQFTDFDGEITVRLRNVQAARMSRAR